MVNSCDESEAALEPFERPVWLKFGDYTRGRTRFQARFSLECRLAKLFAHTVSENREDQSSRGFPFWRPYMTFSTLLRDLALSPSPSARPTGLGPSSNGLGYGPQA
jgi:hypothetical protein